MLWSFPPIAAVGVILAVGAPDAGWSRSGIEIGAGTVQAPEQIPGPRRAEKYPIGQSLVKDYSPFRAADWAVSDCFKILIWPIRHLNRMVRYLLVGCIHAIRFTPENRSGHRLRRAGVVPVFSPGKFPVRQVALNDLTQMVDFQR